MFDALPARKGRSVVLHKLLHEPSSRLRRRHPRHLVLRGVTWHFRVRVPRALEGVAGHQEIWRSLSSDLCLARLYASHLASQLDGLWAAIKLAKLNIETVLAAWFEHQLKRAHALYVGMDYASAIRPDGLDENDARNFDRSTTSADAQIQLERLRAEFEAGTYTSGRQIARRIAGRVTPIIPETTPDFIALCRQITGLLGEIEDTRFRWAGGDEGYRPPGCKPPQSEQVVAEAIEAVVPIGLVTSASGRTLREAIETRLANYKRDSDPYDRLLRQVTSELELLASAFGSETQVSAITAQKMRRLCTALQNLPPHWRRIEALGTGGVFERATKASTLDMPRLDKKTVRGHMTQWRTLFEDEGAVPNPVAGIVIRTPRKHGPVDERDGSVVRYSVSVPLGGPPAG